MTKGASWESSEAGGSVFGSGNSGKSEGDLRSAISGLCGLRKHRMPTTTASREPRMPIAAAAASVIIGVELLVLLLMIAA